MSIEQYAASLSRAISILVTSGVAIRIIQIVLSGQTNDIPFSETFPKGKKVMIAGVISVTISEFIGIISKYYL